MRVSQRHKRTCLRASDINIRQEFWGGGKWGKGDFALYYSSLLLIFCFSVISVVDGCLNRLFSFFFLVVLVGVVSKGVNGFFLFFWFWYGYCTA